MLFQSLLFALILVASVSAQGGTCTAMDVPVISAGARALCIASCSMQNCGTGTCENRSGRGTCVCHRCADGGGSIPLVALTNRIGGRRGGAGGSGGRRPGK